jgi:hypothetical protein
VKDSIISLPIRRNAGVTKCPFPEINRNITPNRRPKFAGTFVLRRFARAAPRPF